MAKEPSAKSRSTWNGIPGTTCRAGIRYCIGLLAVGCLFWLLPPMTEARDSGTVLRDELIGAYIFNLARNITWPDEESWKRFHIHVIEREPRVGRVLRRLVKGLELKGRPIVVTMASDAAALPEDVQLVYLGEGLERLNPGLISRTAGRPVLIISYGAKDHPPIMIDLYQDASRRIRFHINQELMASRKLAISPDLILLGGKEIAINRMYKSILNELRAQQKKLLDQKKRLQEQKRRIEANRRTLEGMKKEISLKSRELAEKRKEIDVLRKQFVDSKQELESLKSSLEEKTSDLEVLQEDLAEARKRARDLQLRSEEYARELREQREQIEARSQILASQQKRITDLDRRIKAQEKKISRQVETLEYQSAQLRQRTVIMMLSVGLMLFALFFMGFFFWQHRRYQRLSGELADALESAKRANEAKSTFLANMSHELRTPLNAILGFTTILMKEAEQDPERMKFLGIVHKSGKFLLTLINDVLDLSRVEAGKMTLERQTVHLRSLVLDVMDMVRERATEKGLSLELAWQGNEDPVISLDAGKLRQIILNLLSNAIKYTDHGGITLRVEVKKGELTMEVEDTGKGISPEDRERIFEPFVQTGSASSNTGTGLGLSIVRQYARLMGGEVGVQSRLGEGSVFRVTVPYQPGSKTDMEEDEDAGRKKITGLAPGQERFRILIVDDQEDARLLLRNLIGDLGLPVKEAENGLEAVRIFEEWRPHLIWMDQRMPVMSGDEAARRIRALPGGGEVFIIALTASFQTEKRQKLLDSGMNDLVAKPYEPEEIYGVMERYLGLRFTYEEDQSAQAPGSDGKAASFKRLCEMLSELDAGLLNELYDAAVLLDRNEVDRVLGKVEAVHPDLAKVVRVLVDNLQYGQLLKSIEAVRSRAA